MNRKDLCCRYSGLPALLFALGALYGTAIAQATPTAPADVAAANEPGKWAFQPGKDSFSPGALLDLRSLNEGIAGETGFVRVDPATGDFLLGSGKPVRFWAINTGVGRERPFQPRPLGRKVEPDLARHARFLAKRGVNMVRLHAHINPDPKSPGDAIQEGERDWIWRTVAAMKKEGIYTTVSPYWANTTKLGAGWNIPGGSEQDSHGLLFFDETLQSLYKGWLRRLFAEKNPYTGTPLAKEPALAIIQLQNEDSLLFWTVNNIKGEQKLRLGKKYGVWLKRKYGSLDAAFSAWQNDRLPGDAPAAGVLDFHNIWEMTQKRTGGRARRLDDQLAFWAQTMYDFNKQMAAFLRDELGCKQLINAGNWKTADTIRLNDAERWSYTANEVLAVNHYFDSIHVGRNNGWAIENEDQFTNRSALTDPKSLPINLKQVRGYPMLVTESAWVMPNGYAAEGPFLISVYQSLTGVAGYYWFATGDDEWTEPQSANGYAPSQAKWICGSPDMLGMFPAAALLYRKGYVRRGAPFVVEERAMDDLWQRRTTIVSEPTSFDVNRDTGNIAASSSIRTTLPPETFLIGPVLVHYGGDPAKSVTGNLRACLSPTAKEIRSCTGQLLWNYDKGYCTVNAPHAQGVAALFKNQSTFALQDVTIASDNDYGTVLVVSLDDRPLKSSGRVLIQAGTQSRPTGWREAPTTISLKEGAFPGFRLESYGRAPWQVTRARMRVSLANTNVKKATALDPNGNPMREIPLQRGANAVTLTLPEDALYTVLE